MFIKLFSYFNMAAGRGGGGGKWGDHRLLLLQVLTCTCTYVIECVYMYIRMYACTYSIAAPRSMIDCCVLDHTENG